MDQYTVDAILLHGKQKLLDMLPQGKIYSNSYQHILHAVPDYYRVVMRLAESLSDSKKRAKLHGMDHDLTLTHLCELWIDQGGKCEATGVYMDPESGTVKNKNPLRISLDRIENTKGYVVGNVRLVIHWDNNAKSTFSEEIHRQMIVSAYKKLTENQTVTS